MSEYIESEWEPVLECDDDDGTHNVWARRVLTDDPKHQNLCFWYIEREKYIEHVGEFYIYDYVTLPKFSDYRFPLKICETLAEAKYWADEKIEEYLLDGYFEQFQEDLEEDEEELEIDDGGLEL